MIIRNVSKIGKAVIMSKIFVFLKKGTCTFTVCLYYLFKVSNFCLKQANKMWKELII